MLSKIFCMSSATFVLADPPTISAIPPDHFIITSNKLRGFAKNEILFWHIRRGK